MSFIDWRPDSQEAGFKGAVWGYCIFNNVRIQVLLRDLFSPSCKKLRIELRKGEMIGHLRFLFQIVIKGKIGPDRDGSGV